jgi:hypothetical protein
MTSNTYAYDAFSSPFLGSFWGISDDEHGRPTADIDGDFDGSAVLMCSCKTCGILAKTFSSRKDATACHVLAATHIGTP